MPKKISKKDFSEKKKMEQLEYYLGDRLKLIRKFYKLNQKQFGKELNIAQGYISEIENNLKPASNTVIKNLKKRYDKLNIKWILTGEGKMFDVDAEPHPPEIVQEQTIEYGGLVEKFLRIMEELEAEVALLRKDVEALKKNKQDI